MKKYIAIGYFKFNGKDRMTSVCFTSKNMTSFKRDLTGNEFVAWAVFTEERYNQIKKLGWMEMYEEVKKIATHYTKWFDITDYIQQCADIIDGKIAAALS